MDEKYAGGFWDKLIGYFVQDETKIMEQSIYDNWVNVGIVCSLCKRPCYIALPDYTPSWMLAKYRRLYGIDIMATCVQGREKEKAETGYNVDYLVSYVAHGEA